MAFYPYEDLYEEAAQPAPVAAPMTATEYFSLPPAEQSRLLPDIEKLYWSLPENASEFNGADPTQTQEYWQDVIRAYNAEQDAAQAGQEGRWSDMVGHLWDRYGDATMAIPMGRVFDSLMGMLRWGPRLGWKGIQSGRIAREFPQGHFTTGASSVSRPMTDAELKAASDRMLTVEPQRTVRDTPFAFEQSVMGPEGNAVLARINPWSGEVISTRPIPNMRQPSIPSYTSEVVPTSTPTPVSTPSPIASQQISQDWLDSYLGMMDSVTNNAAQQPLRTIIPRSDRFVTRYPRRPGLMSAEEAEQIQRAARLYPDL